MNKSVIKFGKSLLAFLLFLGFFFFAGCREEEPVVPTVPSANIQFHNLMKEWYFWYKDMPEINPANFHDVYDVLEALRVNPPDRWSYITSKQEFEDFFRRSIFIGYGFGSAYDAEGRLRVTFVFNTVSLYLQGVRRGWIIRSINGIPITGQRIGPLLGADEIGVSNRFVFERPDGSLVNITAAKQEVIMNSVLHREVINMPAGRVGYLVFQSFTTPSIIELRTAFQEFSTAGITDLILDLRYNGGGAVSAAIYLGSSLLSSARRGEVFFKNIHNDKKTAENDIENFSVTDFNLNLTRLFVITTRATASASELIINGLRPYIDVYVIGGTTHGKPVGMYAWTYRDYAFVPVTFKTVNALNQGDYYMGIPADRTAADDTRRAFGDPQEASLREALNYITYGAFTGAIVPKIHLKQPWEDMTGLRAIIMSH